VVPWCIVTVDSTVPISMWDDDMLIVVSTWALAGMFFESSSCTKNMELYALLSAGTLGGPT